jgi:predicted NBD/HSP70 family sugar kinase
MISRYSELTGNEVQVKDLFDLAESGDADADTVLEETARLVARLIATIGAVVDPSMVVLGGSIGRRVELQKRIEVSLSECFPNPIDIKRSTLGDHAALVGAAAVGLSNLHHTIFAAGLNQIEIELPRLSAPTWRGVA